MNNKMLNEQEISFINVDVEIRADFDLKPILKKLGSKVLKMYCGEYEKGKFLLALELSKTKKKDTPESIIKRFYKLFEKEIKPELKQVEKLVFDIGFDSGFKPNSLREIVKAKTLKRITKINAELAISIYPIIKEKG